MPSFDDKYFIESEAIMTMVLTSAGGILSLLQEDEPELQIYALKRLNEDQIIRQFWAEIADALEQIEILHEDTAFKVRIFLMHGWQKNYSCNNIKVF